MNVTFTVKALEQYIEWQTKDRKTLKKINELITDIQRNGFMGGIGKPEVLKHRKGYSRRIDNTNRLVYVGDDRGSLVIVSCKGHYDD